MEGALLLLRIDEIVRTLASRRLTNSHLYHC